MPKKLYNNPFYIIHNLFYLGCSQEFIININKKRNYYPLFKGKIEGVRNDQNICCSNYKELNMYDVFTFIINYNGNEQVPTDFEYFQKIIKITDECYNEIKKL